MKEYRFYAKNTNKASKAAADYISSQDTWIQSARRCNYKFYKTLIDSEVEPKVCGSVIDGIMHKMERWGSDSFVFENETYIIYVDCLLREVQAILKF